MKRCCNCGDFDRRPVHGGFDDATEIWYCRACADLLTDYSDLDSEITKETSDGIDD